MLRFTALLALSALFVLSGCVQPAHVKAPEPVRLEMVQPQVTDGSLWQADTGKQGLVANNTARSRGDLVTILIVEDTNAKRDRTTKTSRDQAVDAKVDQVLYSDTLTRTVNGQKVLPQVKGSSSRSYSGGGSIADTGTVRATLSAQVTQVLANGNLVVLGQKEVIVGGESQIITLTGIVRPDDVRTDNTVFSNSIAEARINVYGSGPLNDAQRRTLVGRLFDWINLF
jgi:flagellar L-ring protein precursor FlgH